MKLKKQLFLLAVSLLMFLFSPSPVKAIDPGCSAQTPVCLTRTVVDYYYCQFVNNICDGPFFVRQGTVNCRDRVNCRHNACSSNDISNITCRVSTFFDGEDEVQVCSTAGCDSPGNCCGGSGATPTPTPGPATQVNCSNVSVSGGSDTLIRGNTYTLSANYSGYIVDWDHGSHVMKVISGTNCNNPVFADSKIGATSQSFSWTPTANGTYTIYCLEYNAGYATCSGYAGCVATELADYACQGPDAYRMVNVVDPCILGAPYGCSATEVSSNTWRLNWTPGFPSGSKQLLRLDKSYFEVMNGCPGGCLIKEDNLSSSLNSYNANASFVNGTTYYWRIVNYNDASCWKDMVCNFTPPSCTLSLLPAAWTLDIGQSATYSASVTNIRNGTVSSVSFIPGNLSIASVDPDSDPSPNPYQTRVTGISQASTTITAKAIMNGEERCVATSSAYVKHPNPWWQVVKGDVQTNGGLSASIPRGYYFSLHTFPTPTPSPPPTDIQYHFPGVVKYSGSTNLSPANVSERGWLADSSYVWRDGIVQDFAYFRRLISDDILPKIPSNSVNGSFFESGGTFLYGYYWYEYDGSVTGSTLSITSPINLPDGRKVVIFVNGANLNIKGTINYTSGRSILVALVDGNINIDPNVGGATAPYFDLKGFFLAKNIYTGQSTQTSFTPLRFKGSLVTTTGSLVPQRDLYDFRNATESAQLFEYDPASAFLFPPRLSPERIRWKEVAP